MATPTTLPAAFVSGAVLEASQLNNLRGAFRVLQVVSTTKTDTFTATVGLTPTDLTGMTVTITPSATSSQVLIVATIHAQLNTAGGFLLLRGSTVIGQGDAAGSRQRTSAGATAAREGTNAPATDSIVYLDSPNTTSATTYKIQYSGNQAGAAIWLNRGQTDTDTNAFFRTSSTIFALEVSA